MKYCRKCGNQMDDNMAFCQKCGTKAEEADAKHGESTMDYSQFWGLRYKDSESKNEIELTPQGVHIFNSAGTKGNQFNKLIRYNEILTISFERSSGLKSGFLSIVTAAGGVTKRVSYAQLLTDQNTVLFSSAMENAVERIYLALRSICDLPQMNMGEIETIQEQYKSTPAAKAEKKRSKKGCLTTLVIFIAVVVAIAAIISNSIDQDVEVVYDVEQFANITSEKLVEIMGTPDRITEGASTGTFDIQGVYYEYDNDENLGTVTFALLNDKVIRFTSYKEYPYYGSGTVLARFGVKRGDNCVKVGDTAVSVRYRCPSDSIDDFWVSLIDGETFGSLQVTYDMEYYEEWYLPTSDDEQINYKTNTKLMVESLLKAPKTAVYPLTEWSYGKNDYYFVVQSYVDAQNSFGATVRSQFTFIYAVGTNTVVYAVFDGEVIADNGYIKTADLISKLVNENKT